MPKAGTVVEVVFTGDVAKKRRVWHEGTLRMDDRKGWLMDEYGKVISSSSLQTRSSDGASPVALRGELDEGVEAAVGKYFVTVTRVLRSGATDEALMLPMCLPSRTDQFDGSTRLMLLQSTPPPLHRQLQPQAPPDLTCPPFRLDGTLGVMKHLAPRRSPEQVLNELR